MLLFRISLVALMLAAVLSVGSRAQTKGALSPELIAGFEKHVADDPGVTRLVNAATNNDIRDLSLNRELVNLNGQFNFELKGTKIIDQKSSGRCWMFAGCNVVTPRVMTKLSCPILVSPRPISRSGIDSRRATSSWRP